MRLITKTRLDYLHDLIESMDGDKKKREAQQVLKSIATDIEENYAEIKLPVRMQDHYS